MQFIIPVPVPKVWEWAEPFPFPFPNVQKSFPLTPASLICPIDPIPVLMACVTFCLFHSDSKAHFNRWCVPINILCLGVRLIYCNKNSMITLLKYDCQNNCHCYSSKDLFRVIFIVKHNSHRRCSQGCYSREVLLYHFVCFLHTVERGGDQTHGRFQNV